MGSEVSPNFLRGFLIPHDIDHTSIDDANSVYTQQGNRAGDPIPNKPTEMLLRATGIQESTSDLQIKTERAGHPTAGGQFVWVDNATTSPDIGRQLPSNISNYDIVKWSPSVSNKYLNPFMLGLKDGTLLISAYANEPTFVTPKIKVYKGTEDTDSYTDVTVANIPSIFGGITTPTTFTAMCILPDDSILLIFNIASGSSVSAVGKMNFLAYRSVDDGQNWSKYSDRCIDDVYDLGTGTGQYTVEGIQIQALNGQILMTVETRYGTATDPKNRLLQYASIDGGATFTQVTSTYDYQKGFHKVRLAIYKDSYFVSYIADSNELHTMVIPHAFFPIATARNAVLYSVAYLNSGSFPLSINASVNDIEGGELALVIDDDDVIYLYFRICQLTNEERYVSMYSLDNQAFYYMADGFSTSDWYKIQDSAGTIQRPINIQGCAVGGRIAIGHNFDTALAIDNTLSCIYMGGYSTLTYPFLDDAKDRYIKITYDTTYLPYNLPDTISEFTATTAGIPAETIDQGRYKLDTTSTSSKFFTASYTTTLQEGLICRGRFDSTFGGSSTADGRFYSLEIGDGANKYGVIARITNTNIYMIDMHGGGSIANTTIGAGVNEVILAISNNDAKIFICTDTSKHYKTFVQVGSTSTLATGGGGLSGGTAKFGHGVYAGTVNTFFYEFMVCSGSQTGLQMADTIPDLSAMNYPPTGKFTYIADGVRITTVNGPAKLEDEYQIKPRYDFSIKNAFYKNQPTIKTGWRSAAVSPGSLVPTQQIAFNSIVDANGSPFNGSAIMAVHLQGINCQQIKIFSQQGAGAFVERVATDTSIGTFNYDVQAGSIIPNSNNPITGKYIQYNECAGWVIKLTDGTDTIYTRVVSNTEGTLTSATTKKPVFFLEKGITIPVAGGVSDREADLIPNAVTILMYMNGNYQYDKLRIDFMTTKTPEDYIECSLISIGSVVIPGQQYSRGRTISANGGTITEQLLNGVRYTRNIRPTQKRVRLSWSDPIDITTISGTAVDPDYWSGILATADPVSTANDVPLLMLGILDKLQGTKNPLVYLPKINKVLRTSGFILSYTLKRQDEQMLSILTSDVSIESVLGDELQNEVFRVSTITLEEIV